MSDYLDLDPFTSWSYWSGSEKYHYHQLSRKIGITNADETAFKDLADDFASGQVSLDSLPSDTLGVFNLFPCKVPCAAMWDSLENYMVSSRDHENGKCSIQSDGVTDDEQLLARLYLWVFQLGSHRVSQQARVGLKLCISRPNAKAVVNEFIKIAFDDRDVVVEALRLLHDGRNKPLWNDWRDEILQHANSFDLGVSILARQILEQNGISLERHPQTRPVFYDLEIPVDPSGESEPISDIDFEPMRLDDALGWTKPFLNIVEIPVSYTHLTLPTKA